jgi:hypothetical protein
MQVNTTGKSGVVRLGEDRVAPRFHEIDQVAIQYRHSRPVSWYHNHVLRRCVAAAPTLRPGDTVLDYGCGTQTLKRHLPEGVSYVGYDVVAERSDIDDPRGMTFDTIFAIQMLMCLDRDGLVELTDFFAEATSQLVAFVPRRNVLKDQVMDRLLGLTDCRNALVQSTPDEVWHILNRRFSLTDRQNIFWMGDLTCWQKK